MAKERPISSLTFDMKMVKQLYQHTIACDRHRITYPQRVELYGDHCNETHKDEELACSQGRIDKCLHLAKSEGICLMSSGLPGDGERKNAALLRRRL